MKLKTIFVNIVLFVLILNTAYASVVGVSPSITHFPRMIKGGYGEVGVVASTSFTAPIRAHFIMTFVLP